MIKKAMRYCCITRINRSESEDILLPSDNILNYNLTKVLGEGKFGRVYLGYNTKNNIFFAIKKSIKPNILFSNELIFLRKLKHSSLINLRESFIYNNHHYLVLDCYNSGDLYMYIKNHHNFDLDITRKILLNLIRPLLYLKQHKIAHLDIKPENYLVRSIRDHNFVLTDFGTMREYKDYDTGFKLKKMVGTKNYAAPEIKELLYSSRSDIWSLGQIILILISGNMIEYNIDYTQLDIYDLIKAFKVDKGSYNLLKKCFSIDFKSRIKIEDILDDRWVEDYYLRHY